MDQQKQNIFNEEENILHEAEDIINSGLFISDELYSKYSLLTDRFSKLLKEIKKIIKISDGQHEYLQHMQETLKLEIENRVKAEDKLRYLATIDTLTGIYNRGMGISLLEKHLQCINVEKGYFTLCYFDIDNFKYVNDHFGHTEGDELIISLCKNISENIRSNDILCRMGGDEFLIIFPQQTEDEVEINIKIIKERLNSYYEKERKSYKVSFSYGTIQVTNNNECTVDELIERVDKKMYERKRLFKSLI